MSGSQWYPPPGHDPVGQPPPPGWQPPPPPQQHPPAWGPPPPGVPPQPGWAPGMLGAAHKPGAMPLRPLGLGDVYDAAFRIIRFNPRATVGAAVLVAAVAMGIPVVVTAVLTSVVDLSSDRFGTDSADVVATGGVYVTSLVGSVLQYIGMIFVTGMIAHVAAAAAIGRRLSLGEAWAATRGSRWRLVGLTSTIAAMWILVVGVYAGLSVAVVLLADSWVVALVWFGVTGIALVVGLVWLWVRVTYLAVPALMVERTGVFAAIGRGYRLTRRQFWRTFGIALLTVIITSVASQILVVPFAIVSSVASIAVSDVGSALIIAVAANAVGTVLATAFVAPFTAAVTSLQYLDQRIRKEAYDVELMTQAGLTAP
jgi:hypothetical protein